MDACQSGCGLVAAFGYAASPLSDGLGNSVALVAERLPWFFPLAAAVVGGVMASLIGLVVDRVPRMRGWNGKPEPGLSLTFPPSRCESCDHPVPAVSLIPVAGWIISEGRCRECGSRVPWIYPAIEGGIAFLSMAVVAIWGATPAALAILVLGWLMLLCAWMDTKEHEIPDFATVPLFFAGLLWSPFEPDMQARAMGAALCGLTMWIALKVTQSMVKEGDTMSIGDVALAGALGAWAGLCGVPGLLLLSCISYLAYAAPLRRKGTVWVPLGPALCMGLLACLATGAKFI